MCKDTFGPKAGGHGEFVNCSTWLVLCLHLWDSNVSAQSIMGHDFLSRPFSVHGNVVIGQLAQHIVELRVPLCTWYLHIATNPPE